LAHGAAELPGVISLHSQNFRDGAYVFRVHDFDFKRCAGSSRTIRKSSWIRNRALPFTPSNASYKSPSLAGAIDIVTRSRDQFTTSGYVVNKITAAGLRADFKNSIANLAKSHGDGPATFTGQFSISSPTFQSRPEHHCIAMAVAIRR
jgi:hypothetical protein